MKNNRELSSPVLFLIFNRPDLTRQVFSEIRKVKPLKLFIAADGPRREIAEDVERCQQTRDIINTIDWDCEVKTLFRNENLGCKVAVSSAISWFFEEVEEGIILEDDCLPDLTFFRFCEELLEKYRQDTRIMMISGNNFQFGRSRGKYSYYFSRYSHIWGWASWRRSIKFYNVNMCSWPDMRNKKILEWIFPKKVAFHWLKVLDNVYNGLIDSWDYQLNYAAWIQNALSIVPNRNLVSNIGFGRDGTHVKRRIAISEMKTGPMNFPLSHPPFVLPDIKADRFSEEKIFCIRPIIRELLRI
jgi:hypothetical protein